MVWIILGKTVNIICNLINIHIFVIYVDLHAFSNNNNKNHHAMFKNNVLLQIISQVIVFAYYGLLVKWQTSKVICKVMITLLDTNIVIKCISAKLSRIEQSWIGNIQQ